MKNLIIIIFGIFISWFFSCKEEIDYIEVTKLDTVYIDNSTTDTIFVTDTIYQCSLELDSNSLCSSFITTWDVLENGNVHIYTNYKYNYDMTIDWGDGTHQEHIDGSVYLSLIHI